MRSAGESRKGFYLRMARLWHSVSAAIALAGLIGFAITGVTLNHAARVQSTPEVTTSEIQLSTEARDVLAALATEGEAPLPVKTADEIAAQTGEDLTGLEASLSEDEIYISLTRPGSDGYLAIDRALGTAVLRQSDHGYIGLFNDLHKGRGTGVLWSLFIDLLALAIVVFSVTGLILLWQQAKRRKSTWPLISTGLVLPALLAIMVLH